MKRHHVTGLLTAVGLGLAGLTLGAPAADAAATGIYRNCTALHTKYHHGLGKRSAVDQTSGTPVTNFYHSTSRYRTAMSHNRGLDRDHDGIACEQH
jgi:hypothetical protein